MDLQFWYSCMTITFSALKTGSARIHKPPYLCLLLNANCVPDAPLERRVSWFVFFNFASLSKLLKSFQMRWVCESDYLRLKLFLQTRSRGMTGRDKMLGLGYIWDFSQHLALYLRISGQTWRFSEGP